MIKTKIKYSKGCSIVIEYRDYGPNEKYFSVGDRQYFALASKGANKGLVETYDQARKSVRRGPVSLGVALKRDLIKQLTGGQHGSKI